MNHAELNDDQPHQNQIKQRPVLKSIGAMMAGYLAGMLTVLIWSLAIGDAGPYLQLSLIIIGWCLGTVTIPWWAVTVLPTWLLLPSDSILWRPWPATATGAAIGALAMIITLVILNLFQMRSNYNGFVALLSIAAVMGAVTGLVSALLHRR